MKLSCIMGNMSHEVPRFSGTSPDREPTPYLKAITLDRGCVFGCVGEGREDKAIRVFYSYCHKDEALRRELEVHLKILERTGVIDSWHDRKIMAGEEWEDEIDEHLEAADIILLLVSADFIASNYCWDVEMVRAMERHEAGEARVIPVVVRDVNWRKAPFARLQALPEDAKAVMLWGDRDTAWRNVSEGIEAVVGEIRD